MFENEITNGDCKLTAIIHDLNNACLSIFDEKENDNTLVIPKGGQPYTQML